MQYQVAGEIWILFILARIVIWIIALVPKMDSGKFIHHLLFFIYGVMSPNSSDNLEETYGGMGDVSPSTSYLV